MKHSIVFTTLLCFITKASPFDGGNENLQIIRVDQGVNFTLPCGGQSASSVMWIHENRKNLYISNYHVIQRDGSIFFPNIKPSDSGIYSCRLDGEDETQITKTRKNKKQPQNRIMPEDFVTRVRIDVLTPPLSLRNVTVVPFTISASVEWTLDGNGDGGHPIRNFQIAYTLKNSSEWKTCLPAFISPKDRQYNIYHLIPNSTYLIKVWANNKLGAGVPVVVEMMTNNDPQEIELSKHFLDGIDSFDVRIWIIAVGIVVTTLIVLGVATCCLFYKEYNMNLLSSSSGGIGGGGDSRDLDGESIELMPNIILNPGYDFESMEQHSSHPPDENSNDRTATRVNNNSVIFPSRV